APGVPISAIAAGMREGMSTVTVSTPGGKVGGFASMSAFSALTRLSVIFAVVFEVVKSVPNLLLRSWGGEPPKMCCRQRSTTRVLTFAAIPARIGPATTALNACARVLLESGAQKSDVQSGLGAIEGASGAN